MRASLLVDVDRVGSRMYIEAFGCRRDDIDPTVSILTYISYVVFLTATLRLLKQVVIFAGYKAETA